MNLIFLWGFMASGKSFWAKRLAKDLNLDLIDMDKEIENEQSASISDIFSIQGEIYFRNLEKVLLNRLLKQNNKVISCGGGSPLYFGQARLMNSKGLTVFIDEDWSKIKARLKNNDTQRPVEKSESNLNDLYLSRGSTYLKAHCFFKPNEKEYTALLSLIQNSYLIG